MFARSERFGTGSDGQFAGRRLANHGRSLMANNVRHWR
jgi:hypothetical protein